MLEQVWPQIVLAQCFLTPVTQHQHLISTLYRITYSKRQFKLNSVTIWLQMLSSTYEVRYGKCIWTRTSECTKTTGLFIRSAICICTVKLGQNKFIDKLKKKDSIWVTSAQRARSEKSIAKRKKKLQKLHYFTFSRLSCWLMWLDSKTVLLTSTKSFYGYSISWHCHTAVTITLPPFGRLLSLHFTCSTPRWQDVVEPFQGNFQGKNLWEQHHCFFNPCRQTGCAQALFGPVCADTGHA